jgi:phosphonate transport system ATP-binding protein
MTIDSSKPIIELKDVQVRYGATCVLDIPGVTIMPGERVFVLGKSGSGKTTLSRVLKGRLRPTQGHIQVFGEDYNPSVNTLERQRYVAMVDQEFNLIPRMSVVRNVLTGALGRLSTMKTLFGLYPSEEWEKAESILDEVDLSGLGNRRANTLSGGQKQRTAIARALMQEAAVLLADEPISNLDPELAEDALELLVECTDRRDATLIVNLHQPRLARKFATRVIGLYEGRVVFDGRPDELSADGEEFIYHGEENESDSSVPMSEVNAQ